MKTPNYWKNKNIYSYLLSPLGWLYQWATFLNLSIKKPQSVDKPVICIGNLTAGGTGKTPVSISFAQLLKELGKKPFFVSRGYGGNLHNVMVDTNKHSPQEVGDEPLLLARQAPVIVNPNRFEGAKLAIKNGADIIVMDDGFQNPTIYKDKNIIIIDGKYGIGNGFLLPSGPLRETFSSAIKRTDFVIMLGDDKQNITDKIKKYNKKIIFSQIKEIKNNININDKYIAFCGIGRPQKFFDSLKKSKYNVIKEISFEDHCEYNENILDNIFLTVKENNAKIITTEKDYVKIPLKYKKDIEVLKIKVSFNNIDELKEILLNEKE